MRGFAPRKCPRGGELVSFTMSNPLLSPTMLPLVHMLTQRNKQMLKQLLVS